MKIAYIDNLNNFGFSVVRYLRDKGFDAYLLLLNDQYKHFRPEADSYNEDYKKYVIDLGWDDKGVFSTSTKKIREALKGYDFICGGGFAPAYLEKAGMKLDLFVPLGGDIFQYPFKYKEVGWSKSKIVWYFIGRWQQKGIRNARYINLDVCNDELEAILTKMNPRGERLKFACPFIYTPQYFSKEREEYEKNSVNARKFREVRDNFDFIVFHHCGHQWKNPLTYFTQKGNDKLIRGFAKFVHKHKGTKSCLIMFEYGPDVEESKKLVAELGIADHVKWFGVMQRKDIMLGISMCDIGAGEFEHSWYSYGVIYEFLALGKPVMHHRKDELYVNDYPELYPMYTAKSEDDIEKILSQYLVNPDQYRQTGIAAGKWFAKYAVEQPIERYVSLINKYSLN